MLVGGLWNTENENRWTIAVIRDDGEQMKYIS